MPISLLIVPPLPSSLASDAAPSDASNDRALVGAIRWDGKRRSISCSAWSRCVVVRKHEGDAANWNATVIQILIYWSNRTVPRMRAHAVWSFARTDGDDTYQIVLIRGS